MAVDLQLIVGLGNPGPKYQNNRHNIGFMVLDELARRLKLTFKQEGSTFLLARGTTPLGSDVHLLKPLTYMNLSGGALQQWSETVNEPLTGQSMAADSDDIVTNSGLRPLVVCDDLALPLGSLRLRASGRSGGQNGLASIIECIGGDNFPRMRLGVAGEVGKVPPEIWPEYVLADFPRAEAEKANDMVNHAVLALENLLSKGWENTVSRFNRRVRIEEES